MKLNELLGDYFCRFNNIDIDSEYSLERIPARALFNPDRIDLIVKLKYIEYREKGYDLTFIKELYKAHIEAFTYGSFREPGDVNKKSIDDYFRIFDDLIDNIKENGVDERISVIPIGKDNIILNGSHRAAIATYFNLTIPIIRFENLTLSYNSEYFRKRLFNQHYLDYIMFEYCKFTEAVTILVLSSGCRKIYRTLSKSDYDNYRILYCRNIKLNKKNQGLINKFSFGIQEGHQKSLRIKVLIIESKAQEKVQEVLSDRLDMGRNCFYLSENHREAIEILDTLLNKYNPAINSAQKNSLFSITPRDILRLVLIKNKNYLIRNGLLFLEKIHLYNAVRKVYLCFK